MPICRSSAWVSIARDMLCWHGRCHRFCDDACLVPVSAVSRPQHSGGESLPGFLLLRGWYEVDRSPRAEGRRGGGRAGIGFTVWISAMVARNRAAIRRSGCRWSAFEFTRRGGLPRAIAWAVRAMVFWLGFHDRQTRSDSDRRGESVSGNPKVPEPTVSRPVVVSMVGFGRSPVEGVEKNR